MNHKPSIWRILGLESAAATDPELNFDKNYSGDDEGEAVVDKTLIRRDLVTPSYRILEYVEPILEKNLPKAEGKIARYIGQYHQKNLSSLETMYITSYPPFTEKDKDFLFDTLDIDRKTLMKLIKETERPESYQILKYYIVDYTVLPVILCRYYMQKKDKKNMDLMCHWFAYSLYWMAYTRTFQKFNPTAPVVQYTINSLTEKFKLKKLGSVNKWIYDMIVGIMITYRDLVLRGADYDYIRIVDAARTKMGSAVKGIGGKIYENASNKNIMFESKAMTSDGSSMPTSALSEVIYGMADRFTSAFYQTPINEKVLKLTCSTFETNIDEVRTVLNALKSDPNDYMKDIRAFAEAVIQIVLAEVNQDASILENKSKFLNVANNAYRKGVSSDPNVGIIRDLLTNWLTKMSPLYRNFTRTASQSNYRKSIYFYMIYLLSTGQ